MKVLVLNSGSSSIKFQLFIVEQSKPLIGGLVEQIGQEHSHIKYKYFCEEDGSEHSEEVFCDIKSHKEGLLAVSDILAKSGIVQSFSELDGIGHRVVHGGEKFSNPVIIDDKVIATIKKLSILAPLHNPANLSGIEVALEHSPNVPQVAVFDTAYHQTIPQYAYMYALPYELYEKYNIRRYGFHGTSHYFVANEYAKKVGKRLEECNLITLHLGNGASVAAIKEGKSIDTSMGFTPLEGLMMGTRSGDMDPAIINYLHGVAGMDFDQVDAMLNKESGLKGVCGNNDLREVIEHAQSGDARAKLALDMFCYRIKKYIGAYCAAIGKVESIVFTGGIGENSALVREKVCEGLEAGFGIEIDENENRNDEKGEREINSKSSRIKVYVIPTNEELEIALQTRELIKNYKQGEKV